MTAVVGTIPGAGAIISTDKDSHFTTQLATNAVEEEDIDFPTDWGIAQIQTVEIRNLTVESDIDNQWDIQFYATDAHSSTDLNLDKFVTNINFVDTEGVQNAGAGQYRYDKNPTFTPFLYTDEDNSSKFHITLVNRDVTTKETTDDVVVKIYAVPII